MTETERTIRLPAEHPLAFSVPKQQALLGHLLLNTKFFAGVGLRIRPEWFADPFCSKIYKFMLDWYKKYRRPPTLQELQHYDGLRLEDQGDHNRIVAVLVQLQSRTQEFGLDALGEELTLWLHAEAFKRGTYIAVEHFNREHPQAAFEQMRTTLREIEEISFTDNKIVDWSDLSVYDKALAELGDALTFGNPIIDKIITPDAVRGSLIRGDSTILLAPINVGKSTALITIAVANAKQGKKVLYISHEDRELALMERIHMAWLRRTKGDVYRIIYNVTGYDDPVTQAQFRAAIYKLMPQYLHYMPMSRPGLTIEDLVSCIRRQQDRELALTGKGYDMVVDDYLAKLTTFAHTQSGRQPLREQQEIVYTQAFALGEELKLHFLTAIQSNRDGSKINRKQIKDVDRLLTPEDVSEAWGPMKVATNIISINRDDQAEAEGRVTFYHCKSRSSEKGWAICTRSDYKRSTTHAEDLPCVYYRGNAPLSQKMAAWLDQHGGVAKRNDHSGALTNFDDLRISDAKVKEADPLA